MPREMKIMLRGIRDSGPRRLLVCCGDYKRTHSVVVNADRWGDEIRLSDLEPKFACKGCSHLGADVRPLFEHERIGTD